MVNSTHDKKSFYIVIAVIAVAILLSLVALSVFINRKDGQINSNNTSGHTSNINNKNDNNTLAINQDGGPIDYRQIEKSNGSTIKNYDQVVHNLTNNEKREASIMLLYTLKDNGINSVPADANIRNKSYNQSLDQSTMRYSTAYIVDIPSIGQSYRIRNTYSPIPANNPPSYNTVVECLPKTELLYGNFNCVDQEMRERGQ